VSGTQLIDGVETVDVVVVGGGVVGTAVARLLSLHDLSVVLLEARRDVGAGTSKANTAILHTGFDATPGSLESRLVARGWHLLREYAPGAGIAVEETGALLVAWDDEQAATLPKLADKAAANGYGHAQLLDVAAVRHLEPHLGPGVTGGMLVPDEHIIDPWAVPLAFAHDALANGARIERNAAVTDVDVGADATTLHTARGSLRTRFVVNAAGLAGDVLHRAFGLDRFTIRPRRGELIVFDELARPLVTRTLLPVPTATTKGVLVAPTVFGNVVLGPTADDIDDRGATGSTAAGLDALLAKGRRIVPALLAEEVTAVYAGLRAATEHSDYQVSEHPDLRYVCLGGIRSTGLTASMALAEEALERLRACGLDAAARPADRVVRVRREPLGRLDDRPYLRGGSGPVVCHCAHVTTDEITAACTGPLAAVDIDGLRRRTRTMTGRCQGFFCTAEVTRLTGWDPSR
jgi:glycerol-3-phosphate dehydrogenase